MRLKLDPSSPVPLYHQIAEAVRYRIATGHLEPGQSLPTVRDGARAWGVNLHTVRRAYAELAREGLVETRVPQGTRVLGRTGGWRSRSVDAFVARVVREAGERHGLSPGELAELCANARGSAIECREIVHVVECSESQCRDHAREIEAAWHVTARPWCLSRTGAPPAGPVVATYFHYNDIRRRWPGRLKEIRFAAIHPDPGLAGAVRRRRRGRRRTTLYLCEFDEPKALNIAADLSALFPLDDYRIEPRAVASGGEVLAGAGKTATVLFAPRVWAALTQSERDDPRSFEVRYVFTPDELGALGEHFDWTERLVSTGVALNEGASR